MKLIRNTADSSYLALSPSVLTVGKFDGLHRGHISLISRAKDIAVKEGLDVTVLTFYPNLNTKSHADYLISWREKIEMLESLGVDNLFIQKFTPSFSAISPAGFVEMFINRCFNAKYIIVGEDFKFGANRGGDVNFLKDNSATYGYKVLEDIVLCGLNEKISTSRIKQALIKSDLREVKDLLGRNFSVDGFAVKGQGLASKVLGFPTINIRPPDYLFLPSFGVYKTNLHIGEFVLPAISNLGIRPSISQDGGVVLETHVLYWRDIDISRKRLRVEFVDFVRPEIKFSSLEELKAQIQKDIQFVKK